MEQATGVQNEIIKDERGFFGVKRPEAN